MKKYEHTDPRYRGTNTVGIDECNYSPSLAGDCVVAACWLPIDDTPIYGIDDSKRLSKFRRLKVFRRILEKGLFTVVPASVNDIAQFGVHRSRNLAASLAVCGLDAKLRLLGMGGIGTVLCDTGMYFIDGHLPLGDIKVEQFQAADKRSYLVGAASIVAKTYLDALFEGWEVNWPGYELNRNHGSGSVTHYEALRRHGPSPVHRTRNYGEQWWARIQSGANDTPVEIPTSDNVIIKENGGEDGAHSSSQAVR